LQFRKAKSIEEDYTDVDYSDANTKVLKPQDYAQVERALQVGYDAGDYRAVLRCWNTMKKFDRMPMVSLPQVVESMQRFKKDTPFILKEVKAFVKKFPNECDMACINDLLESLAKRLDTSLMEKIMEMLPSMHMEMDSHSYGLFLNTYFTTRNFQDVKVLATKMQANKVPFTSRSAIVLIKTALKTSNLDDALLYFQEVKSMWSEQNLASTPSSAPMHIVTQLAELACKNRRMDELLEQLHDFPISQELVNILLSECVRQRDTLVIGSVEKLAREQGVKFTDAAYGLLMKGAAGNSKRVQELFDEVMEKDVPITSDFIVSVLSICAQTSNVQMAEKLYSQTKPKELSILSSFVRYFAESEQYDKACDIYEHDILGQNVNIQQSQHLDARMERSLMNAALKCGRSHLAKNLLSSSPSDVAKHITMIRNCASEKNLKGAMEVFETLDSSGVELNSVIYNTVLDACVECRDLRKAEAWMERINKAGITDVVSYNTLIKAHLQIGNFDKARSLMDDLREAGLEPNRVTFNELINALVTKGGESRRKQMWDIVDEMNAAGVKPNQVTISILLKSLNSYSCQKEVANTMDLINTMDEQMDEVLLSSVVEACVRIGKPDLLAKTLKQLEAITADTINGSHTYGSLIKAYGHAKDISGVWRCWKEMRSRHIRPTSITLGCMVEAIVGNGDTEGAYELIHQMHEDEQCRNALNSVIYCSVLKGFARERKMDRVLQVYMEIQKSGIELSIVMYNTMIDACARSGRMNNLPSILEDMKSHGIKPNVITYSTMLKGHCQNGDIQTGFSILEQMKNEAHLKPDEIMYNSLLDGCAQNNMVDEGLRLLDEMQTGGVNPSNYTLSILVKLMNRSRRLDQAFDIVDRITKKYKFHPNVHVYTNLIQACLSNQQFQRGLGVLERMVNERVAPENRTYAILVRHCMSKGLFQQAVGLLRGALGLQDALPFLQDSKAVCPNIDSVLVNQTLSSLADAGNSQSLAAPLAAAIRQSSSRMRIDATTQRKVMSQGIASEHPHTSRQNTSHPWSRH
jgi:pentatricopeptide repeat protein